MSEGLIGLAIGIASGFFIGVGWAVDQWNMRLDVVSEGVRQQMRNVRRNRQFVGEDYEVSSYATVTTAEGEFDVIVRQPVQSA